MREHLSDMRLNVEAIELERKFCEGLGFAYLKSADRAETHERSQTVMAFAATNFRRAAANAILLDDPRSAMELFSHAARAYASLRMPYALMMLALAGHLEEPSDIIGRFMKASRKKMSAAPRRWKNNGHICWYSAPQRSIQIAVKTPWQLTALGLCSVNRGLSTPPRLVSSDCQLGAT